MVGNYHALGQNGKRGSSKITLRGPRRISGLVFPTKPLRMAEWARGTLLASPRGSGGGALSSATLTLSKEPGKRTGRLRLASAGELDGRGNGRTLTWTLHLGRASPTHLRPPYPIESPYPPETRVSLRHSHRHPKEAHIETHNTEDVIGTSRRAGRHTP